ncbi:MAG: response regulator [Planctomycetes bacterium]|nr:response regulator [Planctomycetota bacterium]
MTQGPDEVMAPSGRPSRRHVVICVDDEPSILAAFRRLLRQEPYELRTTLDPEEAIGWVRREDISLVIIDQRMPGMTGTDLARAIREISPGTLRVMLTGYPDTQVVVGRMSHGIDRLFTKPWDDWDLRRTIREMLELRERSGTACDAPVPPPRDAPTSPPAAPRPPLELVVSVDCRGRSSAEVIERILPRLRRAREAGAGILLMLENVKWLTDSIRHLMDGLLEQILDSKVRITVVDRSGCVGTYLDALGRPGVPIEVVREPCPSGGEAS